jgi:hypothetical protein
MSEAGMESGEAVEVDMESREAEEHLSTIRRIMESATKLTVLPGKAAIFGGLLVLAASGVTWSAMRSLDFQSMADLPAQRQVQLVALWVAVAVLAVAADVLLTLRMARKRGKSAWPRLGQLAAYAMGPAILVALALSIAMLERNEWRLLPAIWMLLYGVGVWMAGILSVRAPGVLGMAFLIVGAITLFWASSLGLLMVALTFGLGHLIYGVYLYRRFGD